MKIICGRIYKHGIKNACIGIENGKIACIKKNIEGKKIDYGDAIIFPSAIDIHVHFREPGEEYKEDFFTGTKAAALAGVTCIIDMPNNKPPILTKYFFNEKVKIVKNKACIDFGLYAGIGNNVEEMNCIAYKIFLSKDNELYFPDLRSALRKVKEIDKPLLIHAELEECIERKEARNLKEHEKNRNKECEIKAIKKIIDENKDIDAKLHICHVTTKDAIDLIGNKMSFGVTLHHLLFSYESKFKDEKMGKVNPPLRSEKERKKLYEYLIEGKIRILETDHAPHLLHEKDKFLGIPGIDALFPIMLYMVKEGKISFDLLHKMVCKNPSNFLGINKGSFEIGKDADFVVIDFRKDNRIKALSKCGWSPYEGMPCIYPKDVYLRGEKIVENGEFIGSGGIGKMIE